MKTKNSFYTLLFVVAMIQPLFFNAQNVTFKQASVAHPAFTWKPVKITGNNESNLLNGVEFFSHKELCNSQEVTYLRFVNKNSYPVTVSYQTSSENPVVYVKVPGSTGVEGSCTANDENAAKLVLSFPIGISDTEKQKMRDYILSHIVVSQIQ